jgi:hypothetical protein
MKHQSVRDRMNEGEGMVRRDMSHKQHFGQSMREESSHGIYKNQVEMPEMAAMSHPGVGQGDKPGCGCMEFKGQADPISYGQAGGPGCKSDESKIHSQFKEYHWD